MLIECVLLSASLCHAVKDQPIMALAAVSTIMSIVDMHNTEHASRVPAPYTNFNETNPVLRPLLPHPAALYAFDIGWVVTTAIIGHELRTSRHRWLRDLWWLPQMIDIADNSWAYSYSRIHVR